MTNRRAFLRSGAFSIFVTGIGAATFTQAAPVTPPATLTQLHGYRLTNGATALKREDGAWVFWVRIINLDDRKSDISASVQIATDRAFSQIVDVLPVTLTENNSFIAQPAYKPRNTNTQPYYRYLIRNDPRTSPSVSDVVNIIVPWDNASRVE
ncbi:hypothetical protein [Paraburkholderia agricolaris]|uniref:hypothetical protein n=1 Tax=Paraburkholderia agricolaris TaxID=2152888 RepID=UPI001290B75C|nr:hypothetical protein [Paraburkholderia agricolaris]